MVKIIIYTTMQDNTWFLHNSKILSYINLYLINFNIKLRMFMFGSE